MTRSRLPCQVCGRSLAVRNDGLVKPHKPPGVSGKYYSNCRGTGFRHARWPVGQRLMHHSGSVWRVDEDRGNGDYLVRCVDTSRAISHGEWGREMVAHGEYLHRDGWTPA